MKYKDFGQLLYDLRKEKGLTEQEVIDKMGIQYLYKRNLQKWERDLEIPNLDALYKLSEVYEIPAEELLYSKEMTLKSGVDGIHKQFIRMLSLILGISIYGTIWFSRVIMTVTLILTFLWFLSIANGI